MSNPFKTSTTIQIDEEKAYDFYMILYQDDLSVAKSKKFELVKQHKQSTGELYPGFSFERNMTSKGIWSIRKYVNNILSQQNER